LHRCGIETPSDIGQDRRLQRIESAQWKERHVGDAVASKLIDQSIVGPMRQIVVILDADDVTDPASFLDLRARDVAQADVTDQSFALKLGQHAERRLDGPFGRPMDVEETAEVDHIQHLQAQVAQVVLDCLGQFFRRESR
jgi:hypothetical protein